jgi:hypothetical protein
MNEHDAIEQAYKNGYNDAKIKWISVHDRLPDKDGKYLICDIHGNINVRTHCAEYRHPFDISPAHKYYYTVEWWAELPGAPKEVRNDVRI